MSTQLSHKIKGVKEIRRKGKKRLYRTNKFALIFPYLLNINFVHLVLVSKPKGQ